jgi:energy-converting hydrogenase A subunit R
LRRLQGGLKVFITDCEGPISKNDNAFEITSHFLLDGDRFFSLISKYDDVIADIVKRSGYKAGDTLKLITPFLKAYGVTDKKIEEYSTANILLIRGAKEMLHKIKGNMPAFIISTSYQQYLYSLCKLIGFPYENVYCTKLSLDKYHIDKTETKRLKLLEEEILALPMIEIPKNAKSFSQLPSKSQETVRYLDGIFLEEIPRMSLGMMLEEIKPIGGEEKAVSIKHIVKKIGCSLSAVMYVGDSITDVPAFQLVREGRGLTISFNGNDYAVRKAEVAALSENAIIISVLADVFHKFGREGTLKLVKNWNYDSLKKYCSEDVLNELFKIYPESLPEVKSVTKENVDKLAEESKIFRKTVRGEAIGGLG